MYLSGITQGKIATLGSIQLNFLGHKIKMHSVPDNFPIVQEGILGAEFLSDNATIDFSRKVLCWQGAKIPFAQHDSMVVPARSRTTFYINIENTEVEIGYVPRLNVHKDIFVGEALVKNRNGKAYLQITNTGEIDREIVIPTIHTGNRTH
ncbi:hypothetical protein P5V15_015749 [Pogonomyrmex californicus]